MQKAGKKHTYVVIATAMQRTPLLISRSLRSVYLQKNTDPGKVNVIIVDDNNINGTPDLTEFLNVMKSVNALRQQLRIPESDFPTALIRNNRTSGNSGTGAWNTGVFQAYEKCKDGYISILDDDDEYLENHLADCLAVCDSDTSAVFQALKWRFDNGDEMQFPLSDKAITPEAFFTGNPGVQGSNLFIRIKDFVNIGGFDESFQATTDREFMIRFLWYLQNNTLGRIRTLQNVGVIHHCHSNARVTTSGDRKLKSLDLFYRKFRTHFSNELYCMSLKRAAFLFNYSVTSHE